MWDSQIRLNIDNKLLLFIGCEYLVVDVGGIYDDQVSWLFKEINSMC